MSPQYLVKGSTEGIYDAFRTINPQHLLVFLMILQDLVVTCLHFYKQVDVDFPSSFFGYHKCTSFWRVVPC